MESELYNNVKTQPAEDCMPSRLLDCKKDLSDFTFLMPLRIDSAERKENADASINFILRDFNTKFIVVEGDATRNYYPDFKNENFSYEFIEDENAFFHKTKYINRLIELADTPFVGVWDSDAIIPPGQVFNSAVKIRTGEAVMSIPYDGRVFVCDQYLSGLFKKTEKIEILFKHISALPLMYGYHSTGGAFLTNKEEYIKTGGENENFHGWGPEDVERVKRLEILSLPVHFEDGPFFHLWHPRGKTSRYLDKTNQIKNRREFIETCKKESANLQ